ncbi:MAG TPA: DUF2382 domain-containing protein, partial [Vicinamibacterales bacterium]|nr:DUF2382 domain-containing protein [Vicinamibacterales bacterium]
MTESNPYGEHLKPISELSNYTIEQGDPDPRGYVVLANDGSIIGEVEDLIVDTRAMKVEYLVVEPNSDTTARGDATGAVLLPARDVDVRRDSRQVIAARFTGTETPYARRDISDRTSTTDRDHTRLTRSEEELQIGKHVETEHVSQPVTRRREEVVVERRPVEAGARAHATMSDEEIRVPLTEEEVVVEKRPVVKEELVVGKRVVEERDTVHAEVRREEFDIDPDLDRSAGP